MRRLLPALMLLGLTATVVAQAPQTRAPECKTATKMELGVMDVRGTVTNIRGGAKFTVNGIEIYADEATMDSLTQEVTLRGNVRVRLPK